MSNDVRIGTTGKIIRRCACRGVIVADESMTPNTVEAVEDHRLSEPHKSWNLEQWQEQNTFPQAVRTVLRKVA